MRSWKAWLVVATLSLVSILLVAGPPAPDHGVNTASLDTTCAPCKDFNQFANGGWMAKNPIPPAYPSWGSANVVAERNREILHGILKDASKDTMAVKGSVEQKIGDYYGSCMDEAKINSEGLNPLKKELKQIKHVKDIASLEKEIAHLQKIGVNVFFGVDSTQDFKNSSEVTGEVDQGGLGLPDRDYYTREDVKSKTQRAEYVKHVTKIFALMGDSDQQAAAEAQTVMDLETQLAKVSQTVVERRDPQNVYHRMPQAELKTLAPSFPWEDYFTAVGLAGKGDINVTAPDFFKGMGAEISSTPMENWRVYLRWHLVNAAAPALPEAFVNENFHFYGTILTGTKELLPRWKRCVRSTDRALGEALGQAYVKKAFPPEAKARALTMVKNLEAALADDIKTLPWMSEPTREQALKKLNAITNKIGYPDKWRDYSAYHVTRKSYVANPLRRGRIRVPSRPQQSRQARGPHRMGHEPAHGQRLLQPTAQ